jgi:hypothetical protein
LGGGEKDVVVWYTAFYIKKVCLPSPLALNVGEILSFLQARKLTKAPNPGCAVKGRKPRMHHGFEQGAGSIAGPC